MLKCSLLVLCWLAGLVGGKEYTCSSDIYCHGSLLHTVQMSSIYHDSKTFVDMKIKHSPEETHAAFDRLMKRTGSNPSKKELKAFVEEEFDPPGSEFQEWVPSDWTPKPRFLDRIHDRALREWTSELNEIWKMLGRKMKDNVKLHQELYSIIYVPHPVIVPGGRFREFYYWDSYWIIRGLLLSEMNSTARGMLLNYIHIVNEYGFIPNGGRNYYTMRTQPPLLIPSVQSYIEFTHDYAFLRENIRTLELEYDFWINNRTIGVRGNDGKIHKVARYAEESQGPRPESYKEDVLTAAFFDTEEKKEEFYSEIKSAAESGWDFSSRWFVDANHTNKGNLTAMKIRSLLPVDLNAILCWNARLLSEMYESLNNTQKADYYRARTREWELAVEKVLWDDEAGAWLDYDIEVNKHRDYFTPSNLAPLWTGCYEGAKRDYYTGRILKYLEKYKVEGNLGGVPTTLEHSGEQWDFPNAWAPLQYLMVVGLDKTGDPWAQDLAFELAEKWVRSNYRAYNETQAMYEKYDVTTVGGHGGGGEYEVQLGFGWSNAVVMEFLDKYGDRIRSRDPFEEGGPDSSGASSSLYPTPITYHSSAGPIITIFLAFLATIAAGCIGLVVYYRRHQYSSNFNKWRYSRVSERRPLF